jgi:hypothetical protein
MTPFSIALGGPLYEAYRRLRLVRPPIALTYRRIAAYICVTWLPLAVLSAIGGLTRGGAEVPFLTHLSVHVQFLIAMPLLVMADSVVHKWLPLAVEEFVSRGVIADRDRPRFEAVIASNLRLRNSTLAEGLVFAGSALAGVWVWEPFTAIHTTTWYSGQPGDGRLTAAGYWYVFVSLPLFRFLLFRWYFRLLIWYRFLAQVARIPLTLDALHPDRAGGLGMSRLTPCRMRIRCTTVSCRSGGSGYEALCQPRIRRRSERSYKEKPVSDRFKVYATAGKPPLPRYSISNGPRASISPARNCAVSTQVCWMLRYPSRP